MYEHVSDIHPVHKGSVQPTVAPLPGSGAIIPSKQQSGLIGKEDVKSTGAMPVDPTTLQQPPQVIISLGGI